MPAVVAVALLPLLLLLLLIAVPTFLPARRREGFLLGACASVEEGLRCPMRWW